MPGLRKDAPYPPGPRGRVTVYGQRAYPSTVSVKTDAVVARWKRRESNPRPADALSAFVLPCSRCACRSPVLAAKSFRHDAGLPLAYASVFPCSHSGSRANGLAAPRWQAFYHHARQCAVPISGPYGTDCLYLYRPSPEQWERLESNPLCPIRRLPYALRARATRYAPMTPPSHKRRKTQYILS